MNQPQDTLPGIRSLLSTVARLRAEDGCPWDRKQTTRSMAPHLLEEAFEAADALTRQHPDDAREELGDVLVNVAMLCQIAGEPPAAASPDDLRGFDLDTVAAAAADKLVRRHPHVFGDVQAESAEDAYASWERQKRAEGGPDRPRGALDGVPVALPALLRAYRTGQKAAKAGFDWPDPQGPRVKLDEELAELDAAVTAGGKAAIEHELGDVLFSICNLARHLGIEPETALCGTIERFTRRFRQVEHELGPNLAERNLQEMEAAWQRAKQQES
jgi:tetrapyrrole methylase family protein/MazG family protein